ncbi:MAG: EAL domain-containing protein [Gammaproteobacteria bacterium]|nr:EAL domain-containing protein [Gammaproteobacteria bacterium]
MSLRHITFHLPMTALALLLGLGITAALTTIAYNEVMKRQQQSYDTEVDLINVTIARKIGNTDEIIHGMRTLFDASTHVDADEFRLFASDILARHNYFDTATYLPLVTGAARERFEVQMRDQGYATFSITERSPAVHNGQMRPAVERERYFPVIYHEPFNPLSAKQIGYDYLSIPGWEAAIAYAIDSAKASATTLSYDDKGHLTYTVFEAIYAGKSTPDDRQTRRETVNGLIALKVNVEKIVMGIALNSPMYVRFSIDAEPELFNLDSMDGSNTQSNSLLITWFKSRDAIASANRKFIVEIDKPLSWLDIDNRLLVLALAIGGGITLLLLMLTRNIKLRAKDLEKRNLQIQELVTSRTHELATEKERAQITLKSLGDAVIATDSHGNVEYLNPVAARLIGCDRAAALGNPVETIFAIKNEVSGNAIENPVTTCLRDGETIYLPDQTLLINTAGQHHPIEGSAAPICDWEDRFTGTVLVFRDVGQARKMAKQMAHQATHDALTGLPNRALLMDRLRQVLTRAPWHRKIIATMFLDLDRFKMVNDTLGHDVGDELLKQVATRLENCLRKGDTVSRLGGDEFVVLLTDIAKIEDVGVVVEKILAALREPFLIDERDFFTTASIGISLYPDHGKEATVLLKNADTAMYCAKAKGKNAYAFYCQSMNEQSARRLSLETDLRRALERNELRIHYQPQIDVGTGRIIGAEALVRWQHPTLGMLPPIEFIPLAEESGLIVPIGDWVLHEACRQNRAWQDDGLPHFCMAVNVANLQLQRGSLVLDVSRALKTSGMKAQYLDLELTEGVLAQDADTATKTLTQLTNMGIKLSIDDFGTGYSSLSYLKRFPVNALKVDRCFVKDVIVDADDAAICTTIISIAHNLNLSVIAEGVETAEQLQFLIERGCHCIQGYFFSRPLPPDQFVKLLEKEKRERTALDLPA